VGELAALKVSRVDLPRHRLSVAEAVSEVRGKLIWGTPKSHQARSVPIPGFLVDDLTVAMAGKAPAALNKGPNEMVDADNTFLCSCSVPIPIMVTPYTGSSLSPGMLFALPPRSKVIV
jgi:hypothetical protein